MKPGSDGRSPGDQPVERLGTPLLLAEAPHHIAWTTPASAVAYAGQNLQMTVQQDLHVSAGETIATVSGEHVSLFAQSGPLRVIAAQGPVSLQAHDGELELLSEQALTITATDDRIDVLAQSKVVLQAGSSAITLEGGNITFSCPGEFKVKAGEHPFMGGESSQPLLTALPLGLTSRALDLKYAYKDLKPVVGAPFRVMFDNGTSVEGKLDDKGEARVENPPGPGKVFFGYDQRDAFAYPPRPANPIFGFVPTSPENAQQALERYAKAENEYMEDNYFPDEVAAIYSGEETYDDLVNAYNYFDELEEAHAGDGTPGEHKEIVLDESGKDAGENA